jgi:hypothetical protein
MSVAASAFTFFSHPLAEEIFLKLVRSTTTADEEQLIRSSYLGFVVARPLPEAIIGRTVLATYPSDAGRRNYIGVKEYRANLFGIELSVKSLAFQEQDTVLAACATVSLWCCFQKTGELFGTPMPTPAAITRAATHVIHDARPIPSHGLNVQQICNAIKSVGLEPEVIHIKKDVQLPLVSLIYGYLRMGLPVILGVSIEGRGRHAITVSGYSLRDTRVVGKEVVGGQSSIPMIGMRIDEFYAHDDQIGPFSRVRVNTIAANQKPDYPVVFEGSWTDKQSGKHLLFYPDVVIVPVYHKSRVTFKDILKWLTLLTEIHSLLFPQRDQLEWDVHLITTNDYKKAIKKLPSLQETTKESLLLKQHPRFIWRAILRHNTVDILEVLADATDMGRSLPIYEMTWYNDEIKAIVNQFLEAPQLQPLWDEFLPQQFRTFLKARTKQ